MRVHVRKFYCRYAVTVKEELKKNTLVWLDFVPRGAPVTALNHYMDVYGIIWSQGVIRIIRVTRLFPTKPHLLLPRQFYIYINGSYYRRNYIRHK